MVTKKVVSKEEYKPVFETVIIIKKKTVDLNWLALGIKFRRKINKIQSVVNKFESLNIKHHFVSMWDKYVNWFNKKFNGGNE